MKQNMLEVLYILLNKNTNTAIPDIIWIKSNLPSCVFYLITL